MQSIIQLGHALQNEALIVSMMLRKLSEHVYGASELVRESDEGIASGGVGRTGA